MAGPLERVCEGTLMPGAGAGTFTRLNLAEGVQEALQELYVFVVDKVGLFGAKAADLLGIIISHSKNVLFSMREFSLRSSDIVREKED